MKKITLFSLLIFIFSLSANAQDVWTPSELHGFGDNWNQYVTGMNVFQGKLYIANGKSGGKLFQTTTGAIGSYTPVFTPPYSGSVSTVNSTNEGTGRIYLSTYSYGQDAPTVYSSADGTTWSPYYIYGGYIYNEITHIVPFKGLGTADSIYIFTDDYNGTSVVKGAYNSNDPLDTLSTFIPSINFATIAPYTMVRSTAVHNGKLFVGTSNGAMIWYTADGYNWQQNTGAGNGFGDLNNTEITALSSFGGSLYAGTYNYSNGAQLWKTNDEVTWVKVDSFPGYDRITDLHVNNSELWVCLKNFSEAPGMVVHSSDGITFNSSNANGFGQSGNWGDNGMTIQYNNFIYYGSRNFASTYLPAHSDPAAPSSTHGGGFSTGGQVWRYCLGVAPTVNIGPDQLVCGNIPVTFDAGAGYTSYLWDDMSTTQSITTTFAGSHWVMVGNAAGCFNMDTAVLNHKPTPSYSIYDPEGTPATICKGDTLNIFASAQTNYFTPQPAISHVVNDSIYDGIYVHDTINVSGIYGWAGSTLLSVTIDSLYHQNDGDLVLGLYAPNGSGGWGTLSYSNGGGSSNFINTVFDMNAAHNIYSSGASGPFTGHFQPDYPFYNYSGDTQGPWVLEIYDSYNLNQGVLKGWSIQFAKDDSILTYSWSPSIGLQSSITRDNRAYPTATTIYTIAVTNSLGCIGYDSIEIDIPALHVTATDDSICFSAGTTLNVTGGSTYYWTPNPMLSGTTGSTNFASPFGTTTFYVNDTMMGCPINDSITIHVDNPLMLSTPSSYSMCFADSVSLYATGLSGTAPYNFTWNDGTTNYYGSPVHVSPSTGTSYTVTMTDAYGCTTGTSASVTVNPSTDIYGHVSYSGGSVTNGTVVAYKHYTYNTTFDTAQVVSLDAAGNYHFTALNHFDYIIKVFADTTAYPTLIPTYYGDQFLWDSAIVFTHYCAGDDTLNVIMSEQLAMTGTGFLRGRILEGPGYGTGPGIVANTDPTRVEGDPIPGIDVKLGKNPGGALVINTQTGSDGYYYFSGVPDNVTGESYVVYVDIPGLGRDSSYSVVVNSATNAYYYLDYVVDSTTIYIVPNAGTGLNDPAGATLANNGFAVYPNPSKGTSEVNYSLNNAGRVSLAVYNVLGVKTADLVNEEQMAGSYHVNLNAKKFNLNSGVYFIRLEVNGKASLHRWVLTE